MAGFYSQKPTSAGRVAGLHLQNPSNPNPTGATKQSSQILQNKPDLARSQLDLAKSRPNPAKSQQFLAKKMQISRGKKSSFRWYFPVSSDSFFPDFVAFFNSDNWLGPTNTSHHRKPNRPIFLTVDFGLLYPSTWCWLVESGLGWKPTHGQP